VSQFIVVHIYPQFELWRENVLFGFTQHDKKLCSEYYVVNLLNFLELAANIKHFMLSQYLSVQTKKAVKTYDLCKRYKIFI